MRGYVVALAAVFTAAAQPPESIQKQRFYAGIDLVQVEVSVLDGQRRPVRNLTAADFTVLEDGRSVPVVAFSPVETPRSAPPPPGAAAWLRETAPDPATNDLPRNGRMVVIMFDDALPRRHAPMARKIALATINALGPADLAAVVYVGRGTPQGFTRDPARLRAALDSTT